METRPVWTITKILDWTKQYFADKGLENPRLDAEVLLCAVLKCDRVMLYVHFEQPLQEQELTQYREYVKLRANHEPIAYILGKKDFLHYEFKVNSNVLIPRPETELLVENLAKAIGEDAVSFLDIGTGSGAIAISLLKMLPNATGTAVDISVGALTVAKENAEILEVSDRLKFVESDLYTQLPKEKQFDVVVSNPPYISEVDMEKLALDVKKEPTLALVAGVDGLDIYKKICAEVNEYLKEDGMLAFEVGINEGEPVEDLCKAAGLEITTIAFDYANIDRMVFACRKDSKYANFVLGLKK